MPLLYHRISVLAFATLSNCYASEVEMTVRKSFSGLDSGSVAYSDGKRSEIWLHSNSDLDRQPTVSVRLSRAEFIGAEYRQHADSFTHNGRFGKLLCTFFGCSYAGSKIFNGENSDVASLNLKNHSIFLTNLLPPNSWISDFSLSVGYLSVGANVSGLGSFARYNGGVPTLGSRIRYDLILSGNSKLQISLVPTTFYTKNGYILLSDLEFLIHSPLYKSINIEFGTVSSYYILNYKRSSRTFKQETFHINPFVQLSYQF